MDERPAKPAPEWLDHLHESQQWERLERMARDSLEADPDDVHAHSHLAWALLKQGRMIEAAPHIGARLNDDPESADTHVLSAFVEWQKGQRESAWAHLRSAMETAPQHPSLFYLAANFYLDENDLGKARTMIGAARILAPEHPGYARVYIDLHHSADKSPKRGWERVWEFERVLELNPDSVEIHECLGDVFFQELKSPSRSEPCFRRALAIEPNNKLVQEKLRQTIRSRHLLRDTLRLPMVVGRWAWSRIRDQPTLSSILIGGCAFTGLFLGPPAIAYEALFCTDLHEHRPPDSWWLRRWMQVLHAPPMMRAGLFVVLTLAYWIVVESLVRWRWAIDIRLALIVFTAHLGTTLLVRGSRRMCCERGRRLALADKAKAGGS